MLIYRCDICSKEVDSNDLVVPGKIAVNLAITLSLSACQDDKEAHICSGCISELMMASGLINLPVTSSPNHTVLTDQDGISGDSGRHIQGWWAEQFDQLGPNGIMEYINPTGDKTGSQLAMRVASSLVKYRQKNPQKRFHCVAAAGRAYIIRQDDGLDEL